MEHNCEIIRDLLPLYLDDVCSTDSRLLVESHIASCDSCRQLLEELQSELPASSISVPTEESVLMQMSWHIHKRAIASAIGVTAIILYWLVYLWQNALANAGDYRYFSYSFHEIYTIGYLLVPVVTALWLLVLLFRTKKNHTWRKNAVLLILLIILLSWQIGYYKQQSEVVYGTCWTQVNEIMDEYHIVIDNGKYTVTLETTPIVTTLLRTDGTIYGFKYVYDPATPHEGQLQYIWDMVE